MVSLETSDHPNTDTLPYGRASDRPNGDKAQTFRGIEFQTQEALESLVAEQFIEPMKESGGMDGHVHAEGAVSLPVFREKVADRSLATFREETWTQFTDITTPKKANSAEKFTIENFFLGLLTREFRDEVMNVVLKAQEIDDPEKRKQAIEMVYKRYFHVVLEQGYTQGLTTYEVLFSPHAYGRSGHRKDQMLHPPVFKNMLEEEKETYGKWHTYVRKTRARDVPTWQRVCELFRECVDEDTRYIFEDGSQQSGNVPKGVDDLGKPVRTMRVALHIAVRRDQYEGTALRTSRHPKRKGRLSVFGENLVEEYIGLYKNGVISGINLAGAEVISDPRRRRYLGVEYYGLNKYKVAFKKIQKGTDGRSTFHVAEIPYPVEDARLAKQYEDLALKNLKCAIYELQGARLAHVVALFWKTPRMIRLFRRVLKEVHAGNLKLRIDANIKSNLYTGTVSPEVEGHYQLRALRGEHPLFDDAHSNNRHVLWHSMSFNTDDPNVFGRTKYPSAYELALAFLYGNAAQFYPGLTQKALVDAMVRERRKSAEEGAIWLLRPRG